MMGLYKRAGSEEIIFKSRLFAVARTPMRDDNNNIIYFEKIIRSPGVRVLVREKDKFVLAKEYRYEIENYDIRLPGGKIFERVDDYLKVRKNNLMPYAEKTAVRECLEELGLSVKVKDCFYVSSASASIELPLYYFLADVVEEVDKSKYAEFGEEITPVKVSLAELYDMCLSGDVKEEFTVAALIKSNLFRDYLFSRQP